jgi:hypothetical protein
MPGVFGASRRALGKREIRRRDLWRVAEAFGAAKDRPH